ncbi:MAG: hypothetical protein HQL53_11155, partial [Magnetococcales bacterium]|nr:hypothetical protein [Magnetococcales bacterium]
QLSWSGPDGGAQPISAQKPDRKVRRAERGATRYRAGGRLEQRRSRLQPIKKEPQLVQKATLLGEATKLRGNVAHGRQQVLRLISVLKSHSNVMKVTALQLPEKAPRTVSFSGDALAYKENIIDRAPFSLSIVWRHSQSSAKGGSHVD